MSFATVYVLSEVFVSLIVPLLFVAARRRINGPLIACATTAIACFAALWLLSGSQNGMLIYGGPQDNALVLRYILYAFAGTAGQAAWILAVYQASLARHLRWIGALSAAQVVANAVLLLGLYPCVLAQITGDVSNGGCMALDPALVHLISAAWLASPVSALAYALRDRLPRRGAVGPVAAPTAAPADGDGEELELRTERV